MWPPQGIPDRVAQMYLETQGASKTKPLGANITARPAALARQKTVRPGANRRTMMGLQVLVAALGYQPRIQSTRAAWADIRMVEHPHLLRRWQAVLAERPAWMAVTETRMASDRGLARLALAVAGHAS